MRLCKGWCSPPRRQEFDAMIRSEIEKRAKVAKAANIKVD